MKRIIASVGVVWLALIAIGVFAQEVKDANPDAKKPRRVSTPVLIKTPGPLERLQTSPRQHEWAEVESAGGRKVKTWVVYPKVDHPATVVILIHENKGLTDWVRALADEVAEAGFVAVAPDLLSGTAPDGGNTTEYESEGDATKAIYGLKQPQVTSDLDAVFGYAKKLEAGNKVIAVAGFCWGGGQAFSYAAHNPNLAAAFVFYGSPKDGLEFKNIQAPVYGFYGGDDARITSGVPEIEKRMKALDKKYQPVIYKGAKHAFMRQGDMTDDTKDANRKAREEAWARLTKLLGELKPGTK